MEGQDVPGLKEPGLEDEYADCLKTCLLVEGVVEGRAPKGLPE